MEPTELCDEVDNLFHRFRVLEEVVHELADAADITVFKCNGCNRTFVVEPYATDGPLSMCQNCYNDRFGDVRRWTVKYKGDETA